MIHPELSHPLVPTTLLTQLFYPCLSKHNFTTIQPRFHVVFVFNFYLQLSIFSIMLYCAIHKYDYAMI